MATDTYRFNSSNVASAERDEATGDVTVTFSGGGVYPFRAVPKDVWERWKVAQSPGSFFHGVIRGYE